jgi:HEAT repeat protein
LLSRKKPPRPNVKVAKALESVMLGSEADYIRGMAADALKTWCTPENAPGAITALSDESHTIRQVALEIITKYKPPKAIEPVALLLGESLTRYDASKALKAYGPAAESAVLPQIDSQDPMTVLEVVQILHAIGTKKSISALEKVAKSNSFLANKPAERAVEAIRLRERLKEAK